MTTAPVTLAAGVKFSVPSALTVTVPCAGSFSVAPVTVNGSPSTSLSFASTGMFASGTLIGVLAMSLPATGASLTAPTLTVTVTVTVNVGAVNDAPVAGNDIASTPINTPLANIPVLANDSDVDGDSLTVTSATLNNPAQGTVTVNADGTLNFTPASNVTGAVVIGYTVSDGRGGTATATLTVNVGGNTPPDSADATIGGSEDTAVVLNPSNFAFSDADSGQTLSLIHI